MMETDMAAGRIVIPNYMPALDLNGNPVAGAKLYFYEDQTTDLATVYTSVSLNVAHTNPIVADAAGVFPSIFADQEDVFSVAITDADNAPIGGLRNIGYVRASLYYGEFPGPVTPFGRDLVTANNAGDARDLLGGTTIGKGVWLATTSTIALTALGASSPGRGVVQAVSESAGRSAIAAAGQSDLDSAVARIAVLESGGGTGLPGDGLALLSLVSEGVRSWDNVEPTEIIDGQYARSTNSAPLLITDAGFRTLRFRLPADTARAPLRISGLTVNAGTMAKAVFHTTGGAFISAYSVSASGDGATGTVFTDIEIPAADVPTSACDMYVVGYSTEFGRRPTPIALERANIPAGGDVRQALTDMGDLQSEGWAWQSVVPIETAANAYLYALADGETLAQTGLEWAKYAIDQTKRYRVTTTVAGSAAAVFNEYDADDVFLTSQFVGPTTASAQTISFNPLTATIGVNGDIDEALLLEVYAPIPVAAVTDALTGWVPLTALSTRPGEFVKAFSSPGSQFGELDTFFCQEFGLTGVEGGTTLRVARTKLSSVDLSPAVFLLEDETFVYADATRGDPDEPLITDLVVTVPTSAQRMWVTADTKSTIIVERLEVMDDAADRILSIGRTVTSLGLADTNGMHLLGGGHSQMSGGEPQGDYISEAGLRAGFERVTNIGIGSSRLRAGINALKTPGVTIETANPATQDPLGIWGQLAFMVLTSVGHTAAEKQWIIDNWTAIRPHLTGLSDGAVTDPLPDFWVNIYQNCYIEKIVENYFTDDTTDVLVWEGPANDWRFDLVPTTFPDDMPEPEREALRIAGRAAAEADLMTGVVEGTRDRFTWAGALNTLLDQTRDANRKRRFILVEDCRSGFSVVDYDAIRRVQRAWVDATPEAILCPMGSLLGWNFDIDATEGATTMSLANWAFGGPTNEHYFENSNPASTEEMRARCAAFLSANCHPKA